MRKRPSTTSDEPLDIFTDERFTTALAGATRPADPSETEPLPTEPIDPPPSAPTEQPVRELERAPRSQVPRPAEPANQGRAILPTVKETPPPPEPNVPFRLRVPQNLRSEFHRFKAELASVLGGVALDDSNLVRPLIEDFLVEHRDRILEEAAAFRGRLKRPPNGDAVGMAEFDHALGEIFRKARRRRSPGSSSQTPAS